jgi:hypothetical protein
MSSQQTTGKIDWEAVLAETIARQDFYRALGKQLELAQRGEAGVPMVPPTEELTFVDGFLVWKGRPVWWSGAPGSTAPKAELATPGLLNPDVLMASPPVRDRPRERAGLRRWFPFRWRWA